MVIVQSITIIPLERPDFTLSNRMHRKAIKGLRLLFQNPYLFWLYIKKFFFQLFVFRFVKLQKKISRRMGGIVLELDFQRYPSLGSGGALAEQLFDTYQPETFLCIKQNLKPGDVFFDVGASIGYFSAIGASLVGKKGQVHSFEPSSSAIEYLYSFAARNPEYKILINHCAVGDKSGNFEIYHLDPSSADYSLVPNLYEAKHKKVEGSKTVPVIRLDEYIKQRHIEKVDFIKIDVEGYEFPVLKGLEGYFKETPHRPLIICEVTPLAYPLLGFSLEQLAGYMDQYGYETYSPFTLKKIDITRLDKAEDVLFRARTKREL